MKKTVEEIKQEKKRKGRCNICREYSHYWEKVNDKIYCVEHYEEAYNKKIKCSQCSKSFSQGQAYGEKTAKFCSQQCCDDFYKEQVQRDSLCKYIVKVLNLEKTSDIDVGIYTQMDNLRRRKKISYLETRKILAYGLKFNKIKLDGENNLLALIPFLYKEADRYYRELKKMQEYNRNNVEILPTRTVIIKRRNTIVDNRIKDLLIQPSQLR